MLNAPNTPEPQKEGSSIGELRRLLYRHLEPSVWPNAGLSPLNWFLIAAILVGTVAAILQTEPLISLGREALFRGLELGLGLIFALEYLVRFWVAAERSGHRVAANRLRFVFSFSGLLDLAIIVATFAPFITANLLVLRLARIIRIVRLAKLGRMSAAIQRLSAAVASRRFELLFTMGLAATVLVFGATALHLLEGELQSDKFGSIPRAMWWSVVTLTTIGYGDVYPVTVGGKIVASIVAVAGIGLIAMTTGILAAAFSDAFRKGTDN